MPNLWRRGHAHGHRRIGRAADERVWSQQAGPGGPRRQPPEGHGMGGAVRAGGDGTRVLAVAAGAAEPRYLLRGRRPPDGAHRHRPRGSMTQGAPRWFPIRYAIQRWNDGKWFYGSSGRDLWRGPTWSCPSSTWTSSSPR